MRATGNSAARRMREFSILLGRRWRRVGRPLSARHATEVALAAILAESHGALHLEVQGPASGELECPGTGGEFGGSLGPVRFGHTIKGGVRDRQFPVSRRGAGQQMISGLCSPKPGQVLSCVGTIGFVLRAVGSSQVVFLGSHFPFIADYVEN